MSEKTINRVKGFSNNGVKWEGEKDFDTSYETIEIVDRVKRIGEGENDFVVVKRVLRSSRPIQEVIDADKDNVGVDNIIKQVLRTGDTSLLPQDKGDCHVDLVGAPETLTEVKVLGDNAAKAFGQLPDELKGDLDMVSFIENMSQEKFDAFIKAISDRSAGKEVKENE